MEKSKDWKTLVAIIVVLSFAVRLAVLLAHPLYLDECLYTEMIEEQLDNPSFVPTYLGFPASWKPPLFYWIYGVFVKILKVLFSDIDLIYKLPNAIIGALNVWLVFVVMKRVMNEEKAFYAALLYGFCALTIYSDVRVMLDTMNTAFILCSLYFYLGETSLRNIVGGSICALFAALTKSVVAFLIPLIVIAHFWNKKKLDWMVAAPLIAVGLGIGLHFAFLYSYSPQLAIAEFSYDVFGKLREGGMSYTDKVQLSYGNAFVFISALFIFGALGMLRFWKENLAMSAWAGALIFPLIASLGMAWYFHPFVPVLAYFTVKALSFDSGSGKVKIDEFFRFVIWLIIAVNMVVLVLWYGVYGREAFAIEKEIGQFLVGRDNVAFIGDYQPTCTAITYKILGERQRFGKYIDFGWVIITRNETPEQQQKIVLDFALDYHRTDYRVNENDFSSLFWNLTLFRKPTAIRSFDYIAIALVQPEGVKNLSLPGYEIVKRGNESMLFSRR